MGNAAEVIGVRTSPILDLQGSMKALDPCNNCYKITTGGRGREERKGGPLNILSALTAMRMGF